MLGFESRLIFGTTTSIQSWGYVDGSSLDIYVVLVYGDDKGTGGCGEQEAWCWLT